MAKNMEAKDLPTRSAEMTAMQRPVMNPDFFEPTDEPQAPSRWRRLWSLSLRLGKLMGRMAFYRPFIGRKQQPQGSMLYRVVLGSAYRLGVGILLTALTAAALASVATHPKDTIGGDDPAMLGLYYDPVSFLSTDGVRLDAWLIPELDAARVLREGEQALSNKRPAVILVHDYGHSRRQMLSLIRPLHEAGFVVLALNLRGCGTSGSSPQLFGLREWKDVKAAVEMLQRRSFVDSSRISAVGIGSGANAVLLARENGADLLAMVLENPLGNFDQAMNRYVLPPAFQRDWMHAMFRWTFEAMYRADVEKLDDNEIGGSGETPTLRLSRGLPYDSPTIARMCQFLKKVAATQG